MVQKFIMSRHVRKKPREGKRFALRYNMCLKNAHKYFLASWAGKGDMA